MKILALYLPQYHRIPENDNWWGEGFTEWINVKKGTPLFKGHYQPKIPLNNNYYDLSDGNGEVWRWQAELAREYGIYGFCIYHYWFEGKMLLEKPMEILLRRKDIDVNYCICWANETWRRTWYGLRNEVLIEQTYGTEDDWKNHFKYLLPFFKDSRYIKIKNRPVIHIYRSSEIENLSLMRTLWDSMAIEAGFEGVFIVSGLCKDQIDGRTDSIDAYYEFEPGFVLRHAFMKRYKYPYYLRSLLNIWINKLLGTQKLERVIDIRGIHESSLVFNKKQKKSMDNDKKKIFPGTCPMWDNTARRGYKGMVTINNSKKEFHNHLVNLKEFVLKEPSDYLYINAWNEWGEGAYLEPDSKNHFIYLEAIKQINLRQYREENERYNNSEETKTTVI